MKPMPTWLILLVAASLLGTTHVASGAQSTGGAPESSVEWTASVPTGASRSMQVRWVDRDGVEWVGLDDIERTLAFDDTTYLIAAEINDASGSERWPDPIAFTALTDAGAILVDLVDGQRLIGLLTRTDTPDAIGLRLGVVCELTLPLERIRRVVTRPTLGDLQTSSRNATEPVDRVDDTLTLVNGDRAAGFLVSLHPELGIELETSSGVQRLDITRVASIEFANPKQPPSGLLIDLKDGRTIAANAIVSGRRELRSIVVDPLDNNGNPAGLLPLTLREIASIVPDPARLVPMASLEIAHVELPSSRRWSPDLMMGDPKRWTARLAPVELPGPMRVMFDLPNGAAAFSAIVRPGVPASAWASAVVKIGTASADGAVAWGTELTLSGDSDPMPVRFEIPALARQIVILVDAAERGAIDDRVRIERGAIHINTN
jgi:hypothetical protein